MQDSRTTVVTGVIALLAMAGTALGQPSTDAPAAEPSGSSAAPNAPAAEPSGSAAPSASTASPAVDPKLEEAKEWFRKGNLLRKAGDCQKALEMYVRSRRLVPSLPNTLNSAFCLDQIGRYDEALEM